MASSEVRVTHDPLEKIPWEILNEMREVAKYSGWLTANEKQGKKDDAKSDKETIEKHYILLKEFGLPTERVCEMFRDMAYFCAKSTTEERLGDKDEAADMKHKSILKQKEMVSTGEISASLAQDLWELCWYSGWHAANSRKFFGLGLFHKDDAKKDAEKVEELYKKIGGDCVLVCFEFFGDKATLINPTKPKHFAVQRLENKSDQEQEMKCQFSHYNTQTKSWSTSIKWKFTVAGAIAGLYFIAGGIAASLSYSKEKTEGGSFTDGETKTYTFPVKVGPHSRITAKGIVQEATAEVPYVMVFDIGGKRYCKEGVWSGIVAGNVEYEIGETEHLH